MSTPTSCSSPAAHSRLIRIDHDQRQEHRKPWNSPRTKAARGRARTPKASRNKKITVRFWAKRCRRAVRPRIAFTWSRSAWTTLLKASSSNPLISLNNLEQLPFCFGQRTFVITPHRYYQQLICTRICEGYRRDSSPVIHAAKKKKYSKRKFKSSS